MIALCRVRTASDGPRWAVDRDGERRALPEGTRLADLTRLGAEGFAGALATADGPTLAGTLLAPIDDDVEVWAAGVTYEVSREARMAESEASADVYRRVYDAPRPELFFKAIGRRVVGPDAAIGVRDDSSWDVPEPELALVVAADGTIVGLSVCNDVSSRAIEGENPLYLPQAKTYRGSCALGPWIVPLVTVTDPYDLGIHVDIARAGAPLWSGGTSTARLHRTFDGLVEHLLRHLPFPDGVVLATGTSSVPPEGITLLEGDVVTITIDEVGTLTNPVEVVPDLGPARAGAPGSGRADDDGFRPGR